MNIAFFGSSLVSVYGNRMAAYYRGLVHALDDRGHRITFYEPDACQRQQYRDMADPEWAQVVVYPATEEGALKALAAARGADLVIKAGDIGVFDGLLERAALELQKPGTLVAYLDVDAPLTLERIQGNRNDPFCPLVARYDLIFTCGGGKPMVKAYLGAGAQQCVPICHALDPRTHHPVPRETRFAADLAFMRHRMPDREARVNEFFFHVADALPEQNFFLSGDGWADKSRSLNVHYLGPIHARDHNAFNCSPRAILNVSRESAVRLGFSPSVRLFEAAGAGACLITDDWEGIELFLEPDTEVLVAANGADVVEQLRSLTEERARDIGQAALRRLLSQHTYAHRAIQFEESLAGKRKPE